MKKLIAATAIAAGLVVPIGAVATAHAAPAPVTASTVQAATDYVQIHGPSEMGQGKTLDISGKAGPNHTGERVELLRDGQIVQSVKAPKVGTDGRIAVFVDAGSQGSHNYEVRLYNNSGMLTAISNVIPVYTR